MINDKEDETQLPATHLVILSIVARGEKYGYQINQMIEKHGIRNWVDIQFSSIYKSLKELEKMGLISSRKEIEEQKTSRRTYKITAKGSKIFTKNIISNLSHPPRPKNMMDISIYSMWFISREQVLDSLKCYIEHLEKRIDYLSNQLDTLENIKTYQEEEPNKIIGEIRVSEFSDFKHLQLIHALFERPLFLHKAERKWIKKLIEKIEKDENYPFK